MDVNLGEKSQVTLTLCMLGNFHDFLSSADFFQNEFQKILSGVQSVSNSLDPDQDQHFKLLAMVINR